MLASKWKDTQTLFQSEKKTVPPVLLVAAPNTSVSTVLADYIASGQVLSDWSGPNTFQFDSSVFARDGEDLEKSEEDIRLLASTIGRSDWTNAVISDSAIRSSHEKQGEDAHPPGRDIKCVVSVSMLSEGWDAPNVTQILGLRSFTSPLLCEQILGRALRRMSYDFDANGFLEPEYADILGVPVSTLPMEPQRSPLKDDTKEVTNVRSVDERVHLRIEFPNISGYMVQVEPVLVCDVQDLPELTISPSLEVTKTTIDVQVFGLQSRKGKDANLSPAILDRENFYKEHRTQKTVYQIARDITERISVQGASSTHGGEAARRAMYFGQVLSLVQQYVGSRVRLSGGAALEEIALERYKQIIERRILDGIQGEVLNSSVAPRITSDREILSTSDINFYTQKTCISVAKSHLSHAVADSELEISAASVLEGDALSAEIHSWVKNERLGFSIPYEVNEIEHKYYPDLIVRLATESSSKYVIIEMKGRVNEDAKAKESAALRWTKAVSAHGAFGTWAYHLVEAADEIHGIIKAEHRVK